MFKFYILLIALIVCLNVVAAQDAVKGDIMTDLMAMDFTAVMNDATAFVYGLIDQVRAMIGI